tara:strand:+ start:255 stop:425 length:171 start_codon:yes stop_codon:yes gene_type:complete
MKLSANTIRTLAEAIGDGPASAFPGKMTLEAKQSFVSRRKEGAIGEKGQAGVGIPR